MKLSLIRPSRNLPRVNGWRQGGAVMAIVLGLAGAFSGPLAVADVCSIKAHGEAVYARVQELLKKRYSKTPDTGFAPYNEINIELLSNCVFKLDGKFHAKKAGHVSFRHFDAEFTRKANAPNGFKKLKLVVDG